MDFVNSIVFNMLRAMHLPTGPRKLIMAYIPTPRLWKQSLVRLSKRIDLAPLVAARDMSVILDEILTDTGLFKGTNQHMHLAKIAKSPQVAVTTLLTYSMLHLAILFSNFCKSSLFWTKCIFVLNLTLTNIYMFTR